MSENLREIVNGVLLPQYTGKKVSITGLVTNINPNGITFDIKTSDNFIVKVNLRKPYKDILQGYIEIHGTAQGKTVICDEFIQFPEQDTSAFDAASYNTLCSFLHSVPDLWKTCA